MKKLNRSAKKKTRSSLRVETLEQRQLLAGITGGGTEVGSNIVAPNGNVYDQVLMTGSSVSVTADAGQITRVSFLDLSGDIVQAEFSGKGTLTVSLDSFGAAAAPAQYNQPGVKYVSGLASFTISGTDATTNFSVFSVGTGNAHRGADNPIFGDGKLGGNNIADVQRITVVADPANANGSAFGGIRAGNAEFGNLGRNNEVVTGVVGIAATNVAVQDVVRIGDINASGTGSPTLQFGANSQFGTVTVAGGDLVNSQTIANAGYNYNLVLAAGAKSNDAPLPAQNTYSQLSFTQAPASVASAAGKSMDLTANVDTTLVGGAGNDTYNASQTSLNSGDQLSGGAGTDTLQITTTAGAALGGGVISSGVEVISVTATVGAATIDATNFTGVTTVTSTGSTAAVTVDNLGVIPTVNVTGTNNSVTVNPTAAAIIGTADSATINLNGAGTANGHAQVITVAGVESLTVNASGTASGAVNSLTGAITPVQVRGGSVANVTITGTADNRLDLSLNGTSSTVTGTLTGSDAVNDVTLATAGKLSGSLAGGNDTLRLASVASTTSISGGDGTDTLIYTGAADIGNATVTGGLSSFEKISITGGASFAMASVADVTYTTAPASKTYTGLPAAGVVNLQQGGSLTLANTALTGSADAVTVNVGNTTSLVASATLASGQFETVTINSIVPSTATVTDSATYTVTGATKVTLNAAHAATLAASTGATISNVDASLVSGAFRITGNLSATANLTIVGGAGADVITGLARNDSLVGGGGADTITGGVGQDTMTGGDAADVFVFDANAADAVVSSGSAPDTITDFVSGTDRLQIAQPNTRFAGNVANIQLGLAAMTAANQSFFVTGENTLYVVSGYANGAGVIQNTDTVIKLSGVTSVTAADVGVGSQAGGSDITSNGVGTFQATDSTVDARTAPTAFNDTIRVHSSAHLVAAIVNGGNGSDSLTIYGGGTLTAADLQNVTGIESYTLANTTVSGGTTSDFSVAIDNDQIASGATLTVSASGLTTAKATFDASAVTSTTADPRSVSVTGGGAADTLTGGTGNDNLTGGAGNDSLTGGAGNDVISGGDGEDTIVPEGTDTITGGAGNDILAVAGVVLGSATSTPQIDLGSGVNTVTLATGAGIQHASLSATGGVYGITVANGAGVTMTPAQFTGAYQVIGGATETITFSAAATVDVSASTVERFILSGVSGTSTTTGSTITVGANQDAITGGAGNDTFNYGTNLTAADTVNGGDGTADTLNFTDATGTTSDLHNVTNIERIILGAAVTEIVGVEANVASGATLTIDASSATSLNYRTTETNGSLNITGSGAADVISGGDLGDTINGGAGVDTITGGLGNDSLNGGTGTTVDRIYGDNAGTKAITTLAATVGAASTGTATVTIAGIATTVNVGATADATETALATAINGNAELAGIATAEVVTNNLVVTFLVDGALQATATASAGANSWTATATATGTAGTTGVDSIDGGAGADLIFGGGGADVLTGSAGDDQFFFMKSHSVLGSIATITDYRASGAGTDRIVLGDVVAALGSVATVQDFSAQGSLGAALNAAAASNTVNNGVIVFIWGGDTYVLVETDANDETTYLSTDFLVKITGTPFTTATAIAGRGFDGV